MRAAGAGMSSDLPWSSVFDPGANMRALSAVQADGFRAASELVDRFVRIAAAGLNANETSAPPPSDEPADLYGATGLEPFVTSWWAMVDQFLRITSPRRERETAEADTATLDFATAQGSHCTGRLQLSTVAPGSATAEVWLHNRGPVDMGKVVLRSGDLLSHEGSVITARLMRLEPDIVPMPARSSRGVTVEVDIDENVAPGSYRGMLVADGHPDVWLPIELVVKPLLP